ncbi:hypothetical protein D049_2996B, partial [Vibrio parahaemolyticus VPTS-2010]
HLALSLGHQSLHLVLRMQRTQHQDVSVRQQRQQLLLQRLHERFSIHRVLVLVVGSQRLGPVVDVLHRRYPCRYQP